MGERVGDGDDDKRKKKMIKVNPCFFFSSFVTAVS
jgi:hypothetical protein